ncbi:S8 family serine peptidase [Candidatus Bathyarchaeota archaeon]|nr:S8 family serine peptidase [Candidatus Bathyarchaeota archaeon]
MALKTIIVYADKSEKQKRLKIRKNVSKVLATYPDGILSEVDDKQLRDLEEQGFSFAVQEDNNKIKLKLVEFETSKTPVPPPSFKLDVEETKKNNYWILQFIGPVKSTWGKKIKVMGGTLKDYLPENAFLTKMSPQTSAEVARLPFVRWVGVFQPIYKVSPVLLGRKGKVPVKDIAELSVRPQEDFKHVEQGNLNVLLHDLKCLRSVTEEIKKLEGRIIVTGKSSIRISLDPSRIEKLAKIPCVSWIEPYGIPELFNNVASGLIAVQPVWNNHGLDGDGQVVGVADTGLDTGANDATMHDDFQGRIINIHDQSGDGTDDPASGHGTHVTGSVLGNGSESNGNIRGMAFSSRLIFQALGWVDLVGRERLSVPANLNDLFQQAYNTQIVNGRRFPGARIHTNSWGATHDSLGNSLEGNYNSSSKEIDEFVWEHKYMTILFAVANAGTDADRDGVVDFDSLSVQSCAKNCISVGASESNRAAGGAQNTYGHYWGADFPVDPLNGDTPSDDPEGLAAFSSRGPTDDGRVKPDVVAPGTNILSTRSSVATGEGWGLLDIADPLRPFYMYFGGTSMATPLTAGVVTLMRQYLTKACRHTPTAALLKALLIHGASTLTGQYTSSELGEPPENNQGWGRVNLNNSLFHNYPRKLEFRDNPRIVLGTGDSRIYKFNIVNTKVPFKATLVWTDYPSTPPAGGLVNTLRLEVTPPSGLKQFGAPADNNVQQVRINRPRTGVYQVRVRGINIATQSTIEKKQGFALVVTGGLNFIDVYVRDSIEDHGIKPSKEISFSSPDIWVTIYNNPDSPPITNLQQLRGKKGYVFVKVHNRGPRIANDVAVRLYIGLSETHKPPKEWTVKGIKVGPTTTNLQHVNVPAHSRFDGTVITSAFEVTPPKPSELPSAISNIFLGVTLNHKEDPVLYPPKQGPLGRIYVRLWNINNSRWDDNVACKRLKIKNRY